MIPIYIDAQDLSNVFNINEKGISDLIDNTVKDITFAFADKWRSEAANVLRSSRVDYTESIKALDDGFARGAVILTGWLPNAIESGHPAFDMKSGFLSGPNAKMGKNGAYNTIPLRISAPGSLAENAVFSGKLPDAVYQAIAQKLFEVEKASSFSTKGLKPFEIPAQYREPIVRKAPPKTSFKDYTHKSSIYEGIIRQKDKVTSQNRYFSFRRVSEKSDPNSWVHKGFKAKRIADKALNNFDMIPMIENSIDNFLVQNGFV